MDNEWIIDSCTEGHCTGVTLREIGMRNNGNETRDGTIHRCIGEYMETCTVRQRMG